MELATATWIDRFVRDGGATLLWGGGAFVLTRLSPASAAAATRRLAVTTAVLAILVFLATGLDIALESGNLGDGWSSVVDPAAIGLVVARTRYGHAWRWQAVAATLLLVASCLPRGARPGRRRIEAATTIAAGALLVALASTGHAAIHAGWLGVAHRAIGAVHVLAAGAWLGALVPLALLLSARPTPGAATTRSTIPASTPVPSAAATSATPSTTSATSAATTDAATDAATTAAIEAVDRFSRWGHVAVALVVASGALETALVVGRWPIDSASWYQRLLLVKVAVVATMIGLALRNRYRLLPRLADRRGATLAAIRVATLVEVALGLTAIALVSVFGTLDPG